MWARPANAEGLDRRALRVLRPAAQMHSIAGARSGRGARRRVPGAPDLRAGIDTGAVYGLGLTAPVLPGWQTVTRASIDYTGAETKHLADELMKRFVPVRVAVLRRAPCQPT